MARIIVAVQLVDLPARGLQQQLELEASEPAQAQLDHRPTQVARARLLIVEEHQFVELVGRSRAAQHKFGDRPADSGSGSVRRARLPASVEWSTAACAGSLASELELRCSPRAGRSTELYGNYDLEAIWADQDRCWSWRG